MKISPSEIQRKIDNVFLRFIYRYPFELYQSAIRIFRSPAEVSSLSRAYTAEAETRMHAEREPNRNSAGDRRCVYNHICDLPSAKAPS